MWQAERLASYGIGVVGERLRNGVVSFTRHEDEEMEGGARPVSKTG
jgi:hypothetical protein